MNETSNAYPWWLWPNMLSLDAPTVAVVWQRFLGASFGVAVPVVASVVLALVVWAVYLADHYLDAHARTASECRHRFAASYSAVVVTLAAGALVAAAALAITLPPRCLIAGGILAALVAAYFAFVHLTRLRAASLPVSKEFLVGALFAAGVAVPLLAEPGAPYMRAVAAIGFGFVCWLNCRLIDRWEGGVAGGTVGEAAITLAAIGCAAVAPIVVAVAIGTACGLLALLHHLRRVTGVRAARVLADLVLLTPLPLWWLT